MRLYDAHCHLQDSRLDGCRDALLAHLPDAGVSGCIVNGTSPADWDAVARLASHPMVRPAFGLHPWKVKEAPADWFEQLQSYLGSTPGALIGEIGLDRWIRDPHFPAQLQAFELQLELSAALDLPPTLHCLRAWGYLLQALERHAQRLPGFLLHSYAGPVEMVEVFVELGAYFSFSGYFLHPAKAAKLEAWRRIPIERVLMESDAPDMAPPPNLCSAIPGGPRQGEEVNHPGNLTAIYPWAAAFFEQDSQAFAEQVGQNYRRLFGSSASPASTPGS